jgi:hypothetical protein
MEVSKDLTFGVFLEKVASHLQLEASKLQLYKDDSFKHRIFGTSSASIIKCEITDGVCLFVANNTAKLNIPEVKPKGSILIYCNSYNRRRKESAGKARST